MSSRSISEVFMSRMTKGYQGLEFTNLFIIHFDLQKSVQMQHVKLYSQFTGISVAQ